MILKYEVVMVSSFCGNENKSKEAEYLDDLAEHRNELKTRISILNLFSELSIKAINKLCCFNSPWGRGWNIVPYCRNKYTEI